MDDESKFQELTSRDEALDRLGSDLGIITDRTGAVLAVTGPTRADLGGSITEGSELADLVHADDRAALLTLLTGRRNTESNIELRLRHAQRWWRTIAVTALVMGNDEIALVGPVARIKERLQAWRETPVTSLLVSSRHPAQLRVIADLVQGS